MTTRQGSILTTKIRGGHSSLGRLTSAKAMRARWQRTLQNSMQTLRNDTRPSTVNHRSHRDRTQTSRISQKVNRSFLGNQSSHNRAQTRMPSARSSHAIQNLSQEIPETGGQGKQLTPTPTISATSGVSRNFVNSRPKIRTRHAKHIKLVQRTFERARQGRLSKTIFGEV